MAVKRIALAVAALAALGFAVLLWQWTHQDLLVTAQGVTPGGDVDAGWTEAIADGTFRGFIYDPAAEAAQVVTYTLRLRNPGLLPAEMVEIQLVSSAGDIAAYQDPVRISIQPGAEDIVSLRLLTGGGSAYRRDLVITYYLWGELHTIRYTLS